MTKFRRFTALLNSIALTTAILAQFSIAQTPAWKVLGNLSVARTRAEAVYIGNNKIFVTGGSTSSGITATSEIIDVQANTIIQAASMATPRSEFASLLIGDSIVLAIGGVKYGNDVVSSIEAYNIKTNTWSDFGSLLFPRRQFTAIWISPQEFIVVGGREFNAATIKTAEIFNIETHKSRQIADYPVLTNNPRSGYTSTAILVIFGGRKGGTGSNQSNLVYHYDLKSNSWQVVGSMPNASEHPPSIRLWSGNLAFCGGNNEKYRKTDWLKDIAIESNNTFKMIGAMSIGRHTHFLAQWDTNTLLIGGGHNGEPFEYRALSTTEWIDLANGQRNIGPSMNYPHWQGMYVSIPIEYNNKPIASKIVVISGFSDNSNLTPAVEILEPKISFEPPKLSEGSGDCFTLSFDATDKDGIVSVMTDDTQSNNIVMSFTPSLPTNAVKITVKLSDISQPGSFRLIVKNKLSLTSVKSGTISGSTSTLQILSANRSVIRDTLIIGQIKCSEVTLFNSGTDSIDIFKIHLERNIEISLPGGGFSYILPLKSTVLVKVCYTPSYSGYFSDTLFAETPCSTLRQPFAIIGLSDIISGKGRCNIGVVGTIHSLFTTPTHPSPTDKKLTFVVSPDVYSIDFYDSFGNKKTSIIRTAGDSEEIIMLTDDMQTGFYILEAHSPMLSERFPVFILH